MVGRLPFSCRNMQLVSALLHIYARLGSTRIWPPLAHDHCRMHASYDAPCRPADNCHPHLTLWRPSDVKHLESVKITYRDEHTHISSSVQAGIQCQLASRAHELVDAPLLKASTHRIIAYTVSRVTRLIEYE
jgi:hypothetical protein